MTLPAAKNQVPNSAVRLTRLTEIRFEEARCQQLEPYIVPVPILTAFCVLFSFELRLCHQATSEASKQPGCHQRNTNLHTFMPRTRHQTRSASCSNPTTGLKDEKARATRAVYKSPQNHPTSSCAPKQPATESWQVRYASHHKCPPDPALVKVPGHQLGRTDRSSYRLLNPIHNP